jgi:hypothetical protein
MAGVIPVRLLEASTTAGEDGRSFIFAAWSGILSAPEWQSRFFTASRNAYS